MSTNGQARSYHQKFLFLVEIDGITYSGFRKASSVEGEFDTITHREGGVLIAQKDPGLLNFPDLTLEQGATDDLELFNWFKETADAAQNAGLRDFLFKRSLDIVSLNRDRTPRRRTRIYEAFCKKFVAGEWDNDASEHVIQQVVLAYKRFDIIPV